jgi:Destabilase
MRGSGWIRVLDGVGGPCLRTRLVVSAALLFLLGWQIGHVEAAAVRYSHAEIFAAIRMVESSGRDAPPDGDGGRAIGPYQIHRIYWADSRVEGDYQDCRRREYAERVIRAYMRRYVRGAWERRDAEVIARTHNGGPRGREKRATDGYWSRVRARLIAQRL